MRQEDAAAFRVFFTELFSIIRDVGNSKMEGRSSRETLNNVYIRLIAALEELDRHVK